MRRWARRGLMIGLYAVLWGLVQGLSPVLVPVLGLYDLLRRNRAATLRLLGLLWVFLFAELLGVTLAGLLWIRHALTPGRDRECFLDEHYRLQWWWGRLLLGASARLLQLRRRIVVTDVGHHGLHHGHVALPTAALCLAQLGSTAEAELVHILVFFSTTMAVDHDGLIAICLHRECGVHAAIIKLDALPNSVRTTAEDNDLLAITW